MKKVLFFLITIIINNSFLSAHEEPAKTIKEKQIREKDRREIMSLKIQSYTVWNYSVVKGTPDDRKEKYLVTEYDKKGNIYSMTAYKPGDSLDYKVIFTYDQDNNMITDTDHDASGAISEDIKYFYDGSGRVKEQLNYNKGNEFDSKFTYEIDNKNLTVLFTKFKPQDKIEYQIIYKYSGSVDMGNNTEIIKQDPTGKLIMRVENVFDNKDSRTHKKIYDENNKLIYYFEYTYDKKTNKFGTILKKSPEGKILTSTVYSYNTDGLTESVKTFDESGVLTSFLIYEYTKY